MQMRRVQRVSEQFAPKPAAGRLSSVQEVARRDTDDVGEAAIRIAVQIEASDQVQQAAISAVGDCHRQRRLIEDLDVAADETAQQRAQALLRGLAGAQEIELLLEVLEGSQAVVLLRKPRMQVVHVSLFEWLKKLPAYTASPAAAPWPLLHSGVAPCEDVIQGKQREIDQMKQVLARLERREQRHERLTYRSPTGCLFLEGLDRAQMRPFSHLPFAIRAIFIEAIRR
jgi:hypothetical protein